MPKKPIKMIPNIPGMAGQVLKKYKDVITQPLYDTLPLVNTAKGDQVFFANPIGQTVTPSVVPKTLWDTNLRQAGAVDRGKIFWMYGISYTFNTSRIIGEDFESFISVGKPYLSLKLLDKIYWESPITLIPAFTGLYNVDAITNTDTVTPFNQVPFLSIGKSITFLGMQNFSLTLVIRDAITLTKSYDLTFYLHGTLARNIQ